MSLLFRAHTHLPKVTIDHRRVINIFTECWKKERASDKNQTPNFYKQWVTCEKFVFHVGSCSDLQSASHDAYNKTLKNPICVSPQRVNWTAFCQRRGSIVVELQCSNTIPSNLRSEAQSLLPVFVPAYPVDVLHCSRSRHACRHGTSGSPTRVSGEI